jgi:hypothetical protein
MGKFKDAGRRSYKNSGSLLPRGGEKTIKKLITKVAVGKTVLLGEKKN